MNHVKPPMLTRVSLRELRELPYRAMRVVGASHGEAYDAAAVAQFAELSEGTGLEAVLASCHRGWASGGLHLTREDGSDRVIFDVHGLLPVDLLQMGTSLADLASSQRRHACVKIITTELNAVIDLPLLVLAERTGQTASASQIVEGWMRVRVATPGGDLCGTEIKEWTPTALLGEVGSAETIIATSSCEVHSLVGGARVHSGEERAAARRSAARDGVTVSAELWRGILQFAAEYKQAS